MYEAAIDEDSTATPVIEETNFGETLIADITDPILVLCDASVIYGDKVDVRQGEMVFTSSCDILTFGTSSSNNEEKLELIKDKYIYTEYDNKFYRIPSSATITTTSTGTFTARVTISECYQVDWTNKSSIKYSETVYSTDPFYGENPLRSSSHYFIGKALNFN